MANLFRVYPTTDSGRFAVAGAPGADVFVAEGSLTATGQSQIARVTASGTIVWQKRLSSGSDDIVVPMLASNGTHVALAASGSLGTHVMLFDADGTAVWTKTVDMNLQPQGFVSGELPSKPGGLAVGSDNAVYITGSDAATNSSSLLVKLNGTTGALDWAVNLWAVTPGTTEKAGPLDLDSSNNVLTYVPGPVHSGSSNAYIKKISSTDGSEIWSRGVAWPTGHYTAVAVSTADDSVYLCGPRPSGSVDLACVVKLDSSGTLVWSRNVAYSSAILTPYPFGLGHTIDGRGVAQSSGAYFAFASQNQKAGHFFIPSAGTISSASAPTSLYTMLGGTFEAGTVMARGGTSDALIAYFDRATPSTPSSDYYGIVVSSGSSASEDGTFGASYNRTTYANNITAGSATTTSVTYTRATAPSVTVSALSVTETAGDLSTESFVVPKVATGIAPTTAFGTPRRANYVVQQPYTVSTAFGTPALTTNTTATSVAPATAFGTPALDLDITGVAVGIAPTTAFGLPWSERSPIPEPHVTTGADPATRFGTPVRAGALVCTASGFSSTAFGTPTMGANFAAAGFNTTAFGTPTMAFRGRATAISPTAAFGTPRIAGYWRAAGANPSTAFGTPRVNLNTEWTASGFTSTAFGTPSALRRTHRARSGVFRTKWGQAQAERTAP